MAAVGKFGIDLSTHRETPNLYVAPSLPSGERKSSTVNDMDFPVYEYERQIQDEMRISHSEALNKRKIIEGRIVELQRKAAKELNVIEAMHFEKEAAELTRQLAENPIPALPTIIADDVTPEKTGELMAENNGKLAILSSEGGVFDILAGRYDSNGTANLDLYLKAYSGDPWRSHRIGRDSKTIDKPLLTMALGLQPIVIEEIFRNQKFRGRGLIGRFLFSHGKAQAGYRERLTEGIPENLREAYRQHILSLLSVDFPPESTISFSDAAQAVWDEFYADIERELREVSMIGIMEPPIFAVMEPVKRVEKGSSDPPFNQAICPPFLGCFSDL